LFDKLVEKINLLDDCEEKILIHNDITYIKYAEGDFFKPHSDYVSIKSNFIIEQTLLICLDANCEGGETVFHLNKFFTHRSSSSITPSHCITFRKYIEHEGSVIKSGYKEIITANLWAIKKGHHDKCLVISFDNTDNVYVMPINNLTISSLFKSKINFHSNINSNERFIKYHETEYTYEEFANIYSIVTSNHMAKPFTFDLDCIINATEAETEYLTNIVKSQKLPYIPFKIIYSDGTKILDGIKQIHAMQPIYASFSEYNNILFNCSLLGVDEDCYNNDDNLTCKYTYEDRCNLPKHIINDKIKTIDYTKSSTIRITDI